jgi:hypothetical protein
MSAKEKAIKLIERFENLQSNKMSDYSRIEYPTAKLCALIVAAEVLGYMGADRGTEFWKQVQTEIEENL